MTYTPGPWEQYERGGIWDEATEDVAYVLTGQQTGDSCWMTARLISRRRRPTCWRRSWAC